MRICRRAASPCGALHEIAPETEGDLPAAFGFLAALLGRMLTAGQAGAARVRAPRALAGRGRPYGHGLARLGLDPARLILVAAGDDRQALWAMQEALHSGVPAAVAGALAARLDLKLSQRLQLAAGEAGIPLVLLRPAGARRRARRRPAGASAPRPPRATASVSSRAGAGGSRSNAAAMDGRANG